MLSNCNILLSLYLSEELHIRYYYWYDNANDNFFCIFSFYQGNNFLKTIVLADIDTSILGVSTNLYTNKSDVAINFIELYK